MNEIIEKLEHVQYSRRQSDKYEYKSIIVCENIPKLSIQMHNDNIKSFLSENQNLDNKFINDDKVNLGNKKNV